MQATLNQLFLQNSRSHSNKLHSLLNAKTEAQREQPSFGNNFTSNLWLETETPKPQVSTVQKNLQSQLQLKNNKKTHVLQSEKKPEKKHQNTQKKRNDEPIIKSYKTKRWTLQQDKLYLKFLEQNADLFRYKSVRRVRQIFTLLSQRMGRRRTPAQCKSHHQKMRTATNKGTIKEMISYIKQKIFIREHMMNVDEKQIKNKGAIIYLGGTQDELEVKLKISLTHMSFW